MNYNHPVYAHGCKGIKKTHQLDLWYLSFDIHTEFSFFLIDSVPLIHSWFRFHFYFSVASGIYQNSLYGLAAKLPMKYSMAIVLGAVSIYKQK